MSRDLEDEYYESLGELQKGLVENARPISATNPSVPLPREIQPEGLRERFGKHELGLGAHFIVASLQVGNSWRPFTAEELQKQINIEESGASRTDARYLIVTLIEYGWVTKPSKGFTAAPYGLMPNEQFEVTEGFVKQCVGV